MKRYAAAHWQGGLRDGGGKLSLQSGVLKDASYSYTTRFESQPGTNPEELLAAAHAGCFAMAFVKELENRGFKAGIVHSEAEVVLEKTNGGFAITKSNLMTRGRVPGCSDNEFQAAAHAAKEGCLVSKVLRTEISLSAELET